MLRLRPDRLSAHARDRLETGLALGDPDGEVAVSWRLAQDLCALYRQPSLDAVRRDL